MHAPDMGRCIDQNLTNEVNNMNTITISKLTAKTELPVIVTYKDVEMIIEENHNFLGNYKIGKKDGYKHPVNSIAELKEWIKLQQGCIEEKREKEQASIDRLKAIREKNAANKNEQINREIVELAKSKGWNIHQVFISHDKGTAIVMVERENMPLNFAFSTHAYDIKNGSGFYWGHYDMSYSSAIRNFNQRIKV